MGLTYTITEGVKSYHREITDLERIRTNQQTQESAIQRLGQQMGLKKPTTDHGYTEKQS
jgi:hypothetical protein